MSKSFFILTCLVLNSHLFNVAFATNQFTKQCYAPDGVTTSSADYAPCIMIEGVDSMCCGTNRTLSEHINTCSSNGLCISNDVPGDPSQDTWWFEWCTDPTWESPNCLSKTTCTSNGELNSNVEEMTSCNNGSFCCGSENNTDCCDLGLGFHLAENLITFNPSSATLISPASVVTVTAVVTKTATATADATAVGVTAIKPSGKSKEISGKSKDIGTGVLIGVSIGSATLVIIGSLAGFFTGLTRGKKMSRYNDKTPMNGSFATNSPTPHSLGIYEAQGTPIAELK